MFVITPVNEEERCLPTNSNDHVEQTKALLQRKIHGSRFILTLFRKIVKSDYWVRHVYLSVSPSVLMKQLGSYWTDFHEILNLRIF